jgi:hypothetical protein
LEDGCGGEEGGKEHTACSTKIAEYMLVGILAVGIWGIVKRERVGEDRGGMGHLAQDEKYGLLEEGRNEVTMT